MAGGAASPEMFADHLHVSARFRTPDFEGAIAAFRHHEAECLLTVMGFVWHFSLSAFRQPCRPVLSWHRRPAVASTPPTLSDPAKGARSARDAPLAPIAGGGRRAGACAGVSIVQTELPAPLVTVRTLPSPSPWAYLACAGGRSGDAVTAVSRPRAATWLTHSDRRRGYCQVPPRIAASGLAKKPGCRPRAN